MTPAPESGADQPPVAGETNAHPGGPDTTPAMIVANLPRREWQAAAAVALALALLLLLPYWLGYRLTPAGQVYTGLLMNPEDSQTYFAKMLQGWEGAWRYTIPFTSEPHEPAFVGVYYLALGHLARLLGLSLTAIWHGARFVAGVFLFLSTFAFVAAFLPERRHRWTAYVLACTGAGLGWLLFLLGQPYWLDAFPVDFKQPEAFLLFTALTFPHVATGSGLMMGCVLLARRLWTRPEPRLIALLGAVNLAIALVYPFLLYLAVGAVGLFALAEAIVDRRLSRPSFAALGLGFLAPAPLLVVYALTLRTNPIFAQWEAQAALPAAPWPHYVLAYGPWLLLAGLSWRRTGRAPGFRPAWAWVVAAFLLLLLPLNAQRRFVQGAVAPLAVLAAIGWWEVALPALLRRRPFRELPARAPRYTEAGLARLLTATLLLIMGLSNLYVLASASVTAAVQQPYPFFRPAAEAAGAAWLRAKAADGAVVLASYESGNFIAAQAGVPVVVGHWAETAEFARRQDEAARFFSADVDDTWRRAYLAALSVRYVWIGPPERALGGFVPGPYLEEVFRQGEVRIYEVRR